MQGKFKPDECAFLIESKRIIREVKVLKYAGGFYTVRFSDSGGGMKVRENRLYATKQEAEAVISNSPQLKPAIPNAKDQRQYKSPWDY